MNNNTWEHEIDVEAREIAYMQGTIVSLICCANCLTDDQLRDKIFGLSFAMEERGRTFDEFLACLVDVIEQCKTSGNEQGERIIRLMNKDTAELN